MKTLSMANNHGKMAESGDGVKKVSVGSMTSHCWSQCAAASFFLCVDPVLLLRAFIEKVAVYGFIFV